MQSSPQDGRLVTGPVPIELHEPGGDSRGSRSERVYGSTRRLFCADSAIQGCLFQRPVGVRAWPVCRYNRPTHSNLQPRREYGLLVDAGYTLGRQFMLRA
jgi:hypothetical protein